MKIAVVLRQVPDLIEPLELVPDEKALDYSEAGFLVNESDEHALEQALLLAEEGTADVTVVAFDFADVETTLFSAAAKGVDRILTIPWEEPFPPAADVAAALFGKAIRSIRPDCVMIGCQAHDELEGALGPRLAVELELPYLGVVRGVRKTAEEMVVEAYKEFPGAAKARMTVHLPAVLGILAADQPPRYVPVSRIREAMKSAEFEELELESVPPSSTVSVTRLSFPLRGDGARMLEGNQQDVAEQIAEILVEKGVLT